MYRRISPALPDIRVAFAPDGVPVVNSHVRLLHLNFYSPRVSDPKGKTEPDSVPEPDVVSTEPEPIPSTEDLERKRKEAITEKRRQSLILARNKITPKKQIRKEKVMEIEVKNKVIPEKPPPKPRSRPANAPKERSMTHHQSTEHLVNQSYTEQLQMRLREQMLYRMMSETFM
jgi:hypothetical protein